MKSVILWKVDSSQGRTILFWESNPNSSAASASSCCSMGFFKYDMGTTNLFISSPTYTTKCPFGALLLVSLSCLFPINFFFKKRWCPCEKPKISKLQINVEMGQLLHLYIQNLKCLVPHRLTARGPLSTSFSLNLS